MDKYTVEAESERKFMMFKQKTVRVLETRLCFLVGLIAAFICAHAGFAAEPEGPTHPRFSHVLRQNEDWSVLAGYDTFQTKSFFDPIKYIPLTDDGNFWMSFGGQIRFRFEGWNNFNFDKEFDDTFFLTRLRLHTDIHTGKYLRFFAEMKSAFSTDRDLPGGRRTLDVGGDWRGRGAGDRGSAVFPPDKPPVYRREPIPTEERTRLCVPFGPETSPLLPCLWRGCPG